MIVPPSFLRIWPDHWFYRIQPDANTPGIAGSRERNSVESLHRLNLLIFGVDGHPTELTTAQICVRGLMIFIIGLVIVRAGDRRSLAQKTAFDALFIVLLGSMLSRAINGSGPLWLTVASAVILMLLHRVCAFIAHRYHPFGKVVKGRELVLIRNGKVQWEAMKSALVSKHDLEEDMRLNAKTEDVSTIELAQLERSGDISFIKSEG
jgi:uncharacterized membrane protein YcaP (DUF421 family)